MTDIRTYRFRSPGEAPNARIVAIVAVAIMVVAVVLGCFTVASAAGLICIGSAAAVTYEVPLDLGCHHEQGMEHYPGPSFERKGFTVEARWFRGSLSSLQIGEVN